MMSPAGSDFTDFQHRRIMDLACAVTHAEQTKFVNSGFRVNSDGTIAEKDALRVEAKIRTKLKQALLDPLSAEGFAGHVSAFDYQVDRTNNMLSTNQLKGLVGIRPLAYAEQVITEAGFTADVG